MHIIKKIFPESANNNYKGSKISLYFFLFIAILGTIRSLIHFLAQDGGAGSIAGMDLSVEGSDAIIFAFALWGSSQLLYAIIQLIVYFRYKNLISFMYILIFLEIILRMIASNMNPIYFSHTPPGAYANYILLPIAVIMFFLSLEKNN